MDYQRVFYLKKNLIFTILSATQNGVEEKYSGRQ